MNLRALLCLVSPHDWCAWSVLTFQGVPMVFGADEGRRHLQVDRMCRRCGAYEAIEAQVRAPRRPSELVGASPR